jgi:uncharacterized protein YjbJ (UPF0337 family)
MALLHLDVSETSECQRSSAPFGSTHCCFPLDSCAALQGDQPSKLLHVANQPTGDMYWNSETKAEFPNGWLMEERTMDWNRVEGNWKQVKGKVKEKWGNLTDDDLTAINGKRDQLEGKIQERYGIAKDQVRKDVDTWYDSQTW